jgi:thiol-disulfide isomerase/thioredoxin
MKGLTFVVVVIAIVAAIWYLQSTSGRTPASQKGAVLSVLSQPQPQPQSNEEIPSTIEPITQPTSSPQVVQTTVKTVSETPVAPTPAPAPVSLTASDQSSTTNESLAAILTHKAAIYQPAREITPGGQFINSNPFTLKDLIGKKVILIDFWTFDCINCQHVIPYLNEWYAKYKDQGLEIVGVHTPEEPQEYIYANVLQAVHDENIQFPVFQDNNYATWQTYGNRYWPHVYLIDIDGYIVYDHIGEGAYDTTETVLSKRRSLSEACA